jgi:hypothetical protein
VNWSPLQYEALEAMGLSPLRLAGANAAENSSKTSASKTSTTTPTTRDRSPKAGVAEAMTAALLRAAGLSADMGESEVLAVCPAPQTLRGDARAKRALWPRLRAMRKG